ncbi:MULTISPECIES: electron transport complex subunit RsxA [Proteiniclasticum]|jgi:electron transport complex protein RnfA|uniref:Ion-translocating oxidoreductase complex subunit A n=2 Tax=Proteiniclasticum TaxID=1155385 RepID=A0A1I4XYE0_9CLOT|nr:MULTISPECIES: electron transport complex subunit RsxA [Proteiniclasticum]SFN30797.1 electron transport complex protein RnfA [Proteiniclasticum ruminis]HBW14436.1 electron transport complex subunit RsxA [Proteiniclasticum sp.]
MDLLIIFINAMLINNFVLSRFLGICSFLGVSKKRDASIGMGLAVLFVMVIASLGTWSVYTFLLEPYDLDYLKTVAFILVIAALVQFVEMVIKKISPALYDALGIFLPLITTNCAVLGVTFLNVQEKLSLLGSLTNAVGAALGYFLAIVLMASIREKLDRVSSIPQAFQGLPIALVTAGLMAIAFLGFQGMI